MDCLDISVIAPPGEKNVAVLARCGPNTAVDAVPVAAVTALSTLPQRLERAILGYDSPPPAADIEAFGRSLFGILATPPRLRPIFAGLPPVPLSFTLLSNRSEFQALPWEYLTEPQRPFGPSVERSIVRVVPTTGIAGHAAAPLSRPVRVLFVSADPIGPGPVDWVDVKDSMERAFAAEMPDGLVLDVVEGATRKALAARVAGASYDIVHFSCHGRVAADGTGEILLVDARTKRESPLTSSELAALLSGRGVRLVVLSACQTSAGNFASDFSVMADALVRAGVPAVVGNQFPVFNNTVATFVGALYRKLLQCGDIDVAVAEGRVALYMAFRTTTKDLGEWGIPTLYRHATAAQLFQV
jgi:hypothetical protein